MKILVIGSGGREHALVWALRRNATQPLELFCAPGNAGIAELAKCIPIGVNDIPALISFSEQTQIDLNIVGPEAPLAAGIVDEFEKRGLRIVGPEGKRPNWNRARPSPKISCDGIRFPRPATG